MKNKIKYPRFLLLLLTYLIVYLIFTFFDISALQIILKRLNYLGCFLSGVLYSYGFTAGPATAFLILLAEKQNIFLSGLIAGLGSVLGDLIIFRFIRKTFTAEINKLTREKIIIRFVKVLPLWLKNHLAIILGSIFIASPFPDELGVMVLASATKISPRLFSVLSYLLNTSGILIILLIAGKT